MADYYYEIRHTVGLEETNLVGNDYVNYLHWQGRCREMFLKEKAPSVLAEAGDDLRLSTLNVECEFLAKITAFSELSIRMRLEELTRTQIQLTFDCVVLRDTTEILVARGRQRIACTRGPSTKALPAPVPDVLRTALAPYAHGQAARRLDDDGAGRSRPAEPLGPVSALPRQSRTPWNRLSRQASLREVMAQFATGVTVITAGGPDGHGMTANAFTSVSLEPPLVLCCVSRAARMHQVIMSAQSFAVSILADDQEHVARYFADRRRPKGGAQFEAVECFRGYRTGTPMIANALAWVECELVKVYQGGDHSIFLGEVLSASCGTEASADSALVFHGGKFSDVGAGRLPAAPQDRKVIS